MHHPYQHFDDHDLEFLVDLLMPHAAEKSRLIRCLREDEEILDGMLGDPKVFEYLQAQPGAISNVSPLLLFSVFLQRVRQDLETRTYTYEKEDHRMLVIFDTADILELLRDRSIRFYLARMLASFVRINSYSYSVRVRKGVWRRYRFSDFDLESLLQLSERVEENRRFAVYRRIADVCLFSTGVFSDYVRARYDPPGTKFQRLAGTFGTSFQRIEDYGRHFYRKAGEHEVAREGEMDQVLFELSEKFGLASKPLSFMADHYLGAMRTKVFLQ
jgi:hypothetical protein